MALNRLTLIHLAIVVAARNPVLSRIADSLDHYAHPCGAHFEMPGMAHAIAQAIAQDEQILESLAQRDSTRAVI